MSHDPRMSLTLADMTRHMRGEVPQTGLWFWAATPIWVEIPVTLGTDDGSSIIATYVRRSE